MKLFASLSHLILLGNESTKTGNYAFEDATTRLRQRGEASSRFPSTSTPMSTLMVFVFTLTTHGLHLRPQRENSPTHACPLLACYLPAATSTSRSCNVISQVISRIGFADHLIILSPDPLISWTMVLVLPLNGERGRSPAVISRRHRAHRVFIIVPHRYTSSSRHLCISLTPDGARTRRLQVVAVCVNDYVIPFTHTHGPAQSGGLRSPPAQRLYSFPTSHLLPAFSSFSHFITILSTHCSLLSIRSSFSFLVYIRPPHVFISDAFFFLA